MSYYITPTEERQRELRRHWFLKNRHLYFFKAKPLKLLSKYERWKKIAKLLKLSKLACQRLEWITYYETKARRDAAFTARHFGISRKTFYKWFNRFQDGRNFPGLEDQDRAPKRKRQREITPLEEERIIDKFSKVAFARMYTTRSSYNARDFLDRLYFLLRGKISNLQHDEGSEFKKYFNQECQKLNISEWFSFAQKHLKVLPMSSYCTFG